MPASGSGSTGMSKPIALATSPKHVNPARRHSRAGTTGADDGFSESINAAESRTHNRDVTHDESGFGERNRTSGRYVVWLSPTSAAQLSQLAYKSGSVLMDETPEPSA